VCCDENEHEDEERHRGERVPVLREKLRWILAREPVDDRAEYAVEHGFADGNDSAQDRHRTEDALKTTNVMAAKREQRCRWLARIVGRIRRDRDLANLGRTPATRHLAGHLPG